MRHPLLGLLLLFALAVPRSAGAEDLFEPARGPYRDALWATSHGYAADAARALERLDAILHDLLLQQAPLAAAPYADDPRFPADLQQLSGLASQARTLAEAGDLPGAHDRLDAYAQVLAELRTRNGVAHVSDRLTAFDLALHGLMATLGPGAPWASAPGNGVAGLRDRFTAIVNAWEAVRPVAPDDSRWTALADAVERAMVALDRALDARNLVAATERAHQLRRAFAALRREFG